MVDITLNVYDSSDTERIGRQYLYFGKSLGYTALWNGWHWVKEQGMTVDLPNVLDNKTAKHGSVVSKTQLREWIEGGFLSVEPSGKDGISDFLDSYPDGSIFRLWFLDWS